MSRHRPSRATAVTATVTTLVVALALIAAGCGAEQVEPTSPPPPVEDPAEELVEPEDEPEPPADEPAEPDEPADDDTTEPDDAPDETDDAEPAPSATVTVFFARATDVAVTVEPVEVEASGDAAAAPAGTPEADLAAIETLFAAQPADPALSTTVPDDVEVTAVTREGRVLVVDVTEAMLATSGGSAQELAFAQQLAHTATALDGIEQVQLTIAGSAITELWGHLDWSMPIEPDPFALSPITIEQPAYDASVPTGSLTVRGEATVFEATLILTLFDADGTQLDEVVVTASEGGPGRGDWEATVTLPEPGSYRLEASEIDVSDGEGRPPFITVREVVATG